MRIRRLIALATLGSVVTGGTIASCQSFDGQVLTEPSTGRGTVMNLTVSSVADGDTFTGKTGSGRKVKVRLLGIDAPEIAHGGKPADCGGDMAAAALREILDGREVTVRTDPRADSTDRYGRTLGYAQVNGVDAGLAQIQHGMAAAWYPSSARQPSRYVTYHAAQVAARMQGVGAWATCSQLGR